MKRKVIPIGTTVIVHTAVDNPNNYVSMYKPITEIKFDPPVIGKIVGGTYMATGEYHPASYYQSGWGDDGDPAYIAVDKMVFVYLVRLGFTNKPIKVLPKDVIDYYPFNSFLFVLPFRKAKNVKWNKKDRTYLREIMKDVPRDSKGRWVK